MLGCKTGGRQAGTPNRITREVKEMVEQALDNAGGVEYLTRQAVENPVAFLTLLGKLLPKAVNVSTERSWLELVEEAEQRWRSRLPAKPHDAH